jgi:acyl-CoA synthetase (AMP-forming)/AMP-acid ligase II
LGSSTFKTPPLGDKSLCLPDFCDWQYRNSPNHPFFLYDDGPGKNSAITWAEVGRGIHRAAHLVASLISPGNVAAALEGHPIVVSVLATTGAYPAPPIQVFDTSIVNFNVDTVTFLTTELGILRAGFAVFPLSPRNSPEAVAHLLRKIGTNHLLAGREPMAQKLATASLDLLRADGHPGISLSNMPDFKDLYPDDGSDSEFRHYPPVKFDRDAPSLILHSSGRCGSHFSWEYNIN